MNREARDSFFGRGHSKQVKAQIVAHDSRQELGIGAGSEVAVLVGVKVEGSCDVQCGTHSGTDAGALIKDLGDVAALLEDSHSKKFVFEMNGSTALKDGVGQDRDSCEIGSSYGSFFSQMLRCEDFDIAGALDFNRNQALWPG